MAGGQPPAGLPTACGMRDDVLHPAGPGHPGTHAGQPGRAGQPPGEPSARADASQDAPIHARWSTGFQELTARGSIGAPDHLPIPACGGHC